MGRFMTSLESGFRIPLFTTLVSVSMALVGFAIAFGYFTNPDVLQGGANAADLQVGHLAFSMGTRSFAMALALLIALAQKSRSGLIAVLTMRLVTECLDWVNMLDAPGTGHSGLIVAAMIVAEAIAIALLLRKTPDRTV